MSDENICPVCGVPSSTMTGSGREWVCMNYRDERHADNSTRYWPATKRVSTTPTPRTDAIPRRGPFHHYLVEDVIDCSKKLEVELAQANDAHDQMEMMANHINMELRAERQALDHLMIALEMHWSFDNHQQHTHSWHDKQDFMEAWRAKIAGLRTQTETTAGASPAAPATPL